VKLCGCFVVLVILGGIAVVYYDYRWISALAQKIILNVSGIVCAFSSW